MSDDIQTFSGIAILLASILMGGASIIYVGNVTSVNGASSTECVTLCGRDGVAQYSVENLQAKCVCNSPKSKGE